MLAVRGPCPVLTLRVAKHDAGAGPCEESRSGPSLGWWRGDSGDGSAATATPTTTTTTKPTTNNDDDDDDDDDDGDDDGGGGGGGGGKILEAVAVVKF